MKKYKIIILVPLVLLLFNCKKETHDYITFVNKSNTSVYMSWNIFYPDTINFIRSGILIKSNNVYNIYGGRWSWEGWFESTPKLQIFIVDSTIYKTVPPDTISKYNMILKRFMLTYTDLQNLGWKITYP